MNVKIKNILHDINKYRDQINCCHTCIVQDLKIGERPQSDDVTDLKQATMELSRLIESLSQELKEVVYEIS